MMPSPHNEEKSAGERLEPENDMTPTDTFIVNLSDKIFYLTDFFCSRGKLFHRECVSLCSSGKVPKIIGSIKI